MIFLAATTENARYLRDIFDILEETVGLKVNQTKSQVFYSSGATNKAEISDILNIKEEKLPVKYLGVPLSSDYVHASHCTPLLWNAVSAKLDIPLTTSRDLMQRIEEISARFPNHGVGQDVAFIATATTVHHIWVERNRRRFERKVCSVAQRFRLMLIDVRLQLMGRRRRQMSELEADLLRRWGVELLDAG